MIVKASLSRPIWQRGLSERLLYCFRLGANFRSWRSAWEVGFEGNGLKDVVEEGFGVCIIVMQSDSVVVQSPIATKSRSTILTFTQKVGDFLFAELPYRVCITVMF